MQRRDPTGMSKKRGRREGEEKGDGRGGEEGEKGGGEMLSPLK